MKLRHNIMAPEAGAPEGAAGGSSGGGGGAVTGAAAPASQAASHASASTPSTSAPSVAPAAKAPEEPKAPAKPSEFAAALAQLEAEKAALIAEREATKKEREATVRDRTLEIARQRRAFVRDTLGLAAPLDDDTLDRLLPDADPRTAEGRLALGKWKEGQTWAFPRVTEAPSAKPEDIIKRLPERQQKSVLFGADALQHAMVQMRR